MSDVPELIFERLRKIRALAEQGSPGERENAAHMLEELCERHGIRPEDLASSEKAWFRQSFVGEHEKQILCGVIKSICRTRQVRHQVQKSCIHFEVTAIQAADIKECFAHYRRVWKAKLEEVSSYFIAANRLYCDDEVRTLERPMSPKEIEKILAYAKQLRADPWKKHLKLTA